MKLLEQNCVGCGSVYLCFEPMVGHSLYCTSSCRENHSIFLEVPKESQQHVPQEAS